MQIKSLSKKIKQINSSFVCFLKDGCIVLEGETSNYQEKFKAGKLTVSKKYLGVINNINLNGFVEVDDNPKVNDKVLDGKHVDVLIIGCGISGASCAREFSKFNLKTLVVEKGSDIAFGQSSRNGGVVHTGISCSKNSIKLGYCLKGNEMYTKLSEELDVPLDRYGQIMFIRHKFEVPITKIVMKSGIKKGVKGIKYLLKDDLKKIDGEVPEWAIGGIHMPTGGITCPYKMSIALSENAASNGVEFSFDTKVLSMNLENGLIKSVVTNRGEIFPKVVVNAAGVHADEIAEMANDRTFTIHPRKGSYMVIDKKKGEMSKTSIGKAPYTISPYQDSEIKGSLFKAIKTIVSNLHSHSKGIGVIHTVDGNILLGPEADEVPSKENLETSRETIDKLYSIQHEVTPHINKSDIITYFSGVRSATYEEDFVVRQGLKTKNIFEMAGIQSPGLTAAPAIALDIVKWSIDYLKENGDKISLNEKFNPIHKFPKEVRNMSLEERNELIKKNPTYGEIICRCEEISKGEIIDSLKSPIPVYTLDAIKRRVRPGMGRCQGSFCSPQVLKIISEVSGKSIEEIDKNTTGSNVVFNKTK